MTREHRIVWALAAFACLVLGAAAVWMGGLNQDEGWYLYAANLVAAGKAPYRDFFYTQGPLMPKVYAPLACVWGTWGLLGARVLTLGIGLTGIGLLAGLARTLAPEGRKGEAALVTFLLLGCNLYHLYYVAIPKTYAVAALFVAGGFLLLFVGKRPVFRLLAGLVLACAAGTRVSLTALLCVAALGLIGLRQWKSLLWFCVGAVVALAAVYGPDLCDPVSRAGLVAAQQYHTARGGFDPVWTVGSVSRLVRWYLPVFIVAGLGIAGLTLQPETRLKARGVGLLLCGFLAVFAVQMLAPFPYEDYQVPVMGLLAVSAAVAFVSTSASRLNLLLVLGLAFASSFGSPLLERWSTNGQDRFWSLKKAKTELAQLREVARRIEALDPGGKDLLTQDTYLAVETGRTVPAGLEMGPFAVLTDEEWRALLSSAPCAVAALSGYSFAIEPPVCSERPLARQMDYWSLLKERYELVGREEAFGQNATTLLILKRK